MGNAEQNCEWHFATQSGGREDGPNDPMQENFKKMPYASLVRESIQNSLDVPLDESLPVRVEFSWGSINAINYPNFYKLQDHIRGCLDYFETNDNAKENYTPMLDYFQSLGYGEKIRYIKISDYNTVGMDYDKGKTDSPFYAFVRAGGVSAKANFEAGGSYGYGKAAYFYISPIRTIFVYTQTKDGRKFFEGASSLCTHTLSSSGSKKYVAMGYYDNNNGNPISNPNEVPLRFRKRNEPGTDIYILGVQENDEQKVFTEMTEAVLRNFWLAIYRKHLVVKVGDEELRGDNLQEVMGKYFPTREDTAKRERNYNPRPYLEAVMHANQDNKHILIEKNLNKLGKVQLYAIKDKQATDKILYMRRPLMLVKSQKTQTSNGFYGVFVCSNKFGNNILRRMENPAHNEWKTGNWRRNGKIVPDGQEASKELETFIKDSIEELFSKKKDTVQEILGLDEFLYIPMDIDEDNENSESIVGEDTDQTDENGNGLTTEISNMAINSLESDVAQGKVLIESPNTSPQANNPNGVNLGGHGTRRRKEKGGGGAGNQNINGRFSSLEGGIEGSFLTEVPVRYRSFAQMENNEIVHYLILHSDFEFNNGRIDLLVGGEQSDEKLKIKECKPEAVIHDNTISGLHIASGKNVIKIKFADNMKHAIKLDAYEIK